jgi:hypothetical protein
MVLTICLIASVFSEKAWLWAREKLGGSLEDDGGTGADQSTSQGSTTQSATNQGPTPPNAGGQGSSTQKTTDDG